MKMRKFTSMLAALVMTAGFTGNMYAGAEENAGGDANFELKQSYMYRWADDDGSFALLSGEISSDDSIFVIDPAYDDLKVKGILSLASESTEYLILPEGCVMTEYDAFKECKSLKAISVPDSITNLNMLDQNIKVVGNIGSYAEFFARNNGNEFIISGDTDLDGKIGATDIVGEMLYLTGQQAFESDISKVAADVSMDGKINIIDLINVKKNVLSGGRVDILGDDTLESPVFNNLYVKADSDVKNGYIDFVSGFSDNVLLNTKDEKEGCNRIYSPLSIYMAVSVLAECSEGESFKEFSDLLCISDKDELRNFNHGIFDSLYFDNFSRYCRMTNSIWLNRNYTLEEDMLKTLADKYYTASFRRDFRSQADCDEISEWIWQNTSGKFRPHIEADQPDQDTLFKIVNTVTFKEKWASNFYGTEDGIFHGGDGDITCPFMHGEDTGYISEAEDFTIYIKNYNDIFRMNFVLPAEGKSVDDILSDSEVMKRVLSPEPVEMKKVIAEIPKFSSESKFDLIPTLQEAGVSKVFRDLDIEPLVNFEKNGMDGAAISDIVHEAVIDVDEKGCEAAAYTMIGTQPTACDPEEYEFTMDRPFLYYISNDDGVPLFIGIVNDPTQK